MQSVIQSVRGAPDGGAGAQLGATAEPERGDARTNWQRQGQQAQWSNGPSVRGRQWRAADYNSFSPSLKKRRRLQARRGSTEAQL
jgi:hypothetical protein